MISALLALSLGAPAHAASIDHSMALADMTIGTESVVRAVVVDANAREAHDGLRTRYTLAVEETLSGRPIDVVDLELPGGALDGLVQDVAGVPRWDLGADVVVFVPYDGRVRVRGVFTVDGDDLLDPLARASDFPRTVHQLTDDLHAIRTHSP